MSNAESLRVYFLSQKAQFFSGRWLIVPYLAGNDQFKTGVLDHSFHRNARVGGQEPHALRLRLKVQERQCAYDPVGARRKPSRSGGWIISPIPDSMTCNFISACVGLGLFSLVSGFRSLLFLQRLPGAVGID